MIEQIKKEIARQWARLQEVRDTPHAVSLGFAAGIYIGFFPLVGLKTLLALLLAWLLRSNKIAAVVGVTLHDISLPVAPVLMRMEYDIGYWLLSHPHHLPSSLVHPGHDSLRHYLNWHAMLTTGEPVIVGAAILGAPVAAAIYFAMLAMLKARERRKAARA